MVCIVGKSFAYLWITTLGEAELEEEILFSWGKGRENLF